VLDEKTKSPIVGANVSFDAALTTQTDDTGWFDIGKRYIFVFFVPFDPAPPPLGRLRIEAPGYDTFETQHYSSFGRGRIYLRRQ